MPMVKIERMVDTVAAKNNRAIAVVLPLVSFLVLFLVLELNDITELLQNIGLGAVVVLLVISGLRPLVGGVRSSFAFRPIARLSVADATKGYVLSAYGTIFLPSAIGGDLFRIEHMKNATGTSRSVSFLVAATERILGLFSLIFLTACVFLFDVPMKIPWHLIGLGFLVTAAILISTKYMLKLTDESSLFNKAMSYTKEYASWNMLVAVFLLSVLFQLVSLSVPVLVAYELSGFDSAVIIALITPAIALFSALPISIGGLGLREASYVGAGVLLGVDEHVCLICGLSLSVSIILSGLPGIFIQTELFQTHHGETE